MEIEKYGYPSGEKLDCDQGIYISNLSLINVFPKLMTIVLTGLPCILPVSITFDDVKVERRHWLANSDVISISKRNFNTVLNVLLTSAI